MPIIQISFKNDDANFLSFLGQKKLTIQHYLELTQLQTFSNKPINEIDLNDLQLHSLVDFKNEAEIFTSGILLLFKRTDLKTFCDINYMFLEIFNECFIKKHGFILNCFTYEERNKAYPVFNSQSSLVEIFTFLISDESLPYWKFEYGRKLYDDFNNKNYISILNTYEIQSV